MSLILLGKKIGMTQVYDENNELVPVTAVEVGPCPVTQVKTVESDGYNAVQIGFGEKTEKRINQPQAAAFKKADLPMLSRLKEFRTDDVASYNVGDVLKADKFEAGQKVDVIATTKGRGFQGVMKRWNFGGGPASHGSMFHRRGGSYGHCQWPGEVQKGKKMPGHMGDKSRTTQNLKVVKVLEDKNIILLKGTFPGAKGGDVIVRTAVKTKKPKQSKA